MKVALLFAGIVVYGIELANGLAKKNDVIFITNVSGRDVLEDDQLPSFERFLKAQLSSNVQSVVLPFRKLKDPRGLSQTLKIVTEINKFNPDVIHVNQTADPRVCLALSLLRNKYPILLTIHDVNWQHGEKPKLQEILRNYPIKIANTFTVHGEKLKQQFIERYPNVNPQNVFITKHGFYNFYTQWKSNNYGEKPGNVLFFGRMQPYKGLDTLEETTKILCQSCPEVCFTIAGAGPELNKREKQLSAVKNVKVINRFIDNQSVAQLFQEASIVVLPYEEASQSGVAAIACAFDKPLVVTDVGSLSEMVQDGISGFVIPAKNPNKLAETIIYLLKHEEIRSNMKINIQKMAKDYAWGTIADKFVENYGHTMKVKQSG